jgi:beta-glucosidase
VKPAMAQTQIHHKKYMNKVLNHIGASLCLAAVLSISPATRAESTPSYLDPSLSVDARINDLLPRLTLEEKISLIHGDTKFTTAPIPRLGIARRWLSDGPHGVREDVAADAWSPAGRTDDFSTNMPADLLLAATWNPDLARAFGTVIGQEAVARGKQIMLGPSVNIQRTPLCGRNFEYMGEDPFLTSRIAVNYIKGAQSQGISSCVKHFALNNQELNRGTIDVEVDERTLREIYLPAFKAAVQEAGVLSVMGAYNQLRGQHCCENDYLLNKILKDEWGFQGLVVSDWGGAHDTKEAALNGLDLEMGTKGSYDEYYLAGPFLAALRRGDLPVSVLDDKVRRNLRVMFATHLIGNDSAAANKGSLNTPEHQSIARHIAEEGIVLLKNQDDALPLNPLKIKSIAVIGANATHKFAAEGGSAGIKAFYEITPLEGILRRVGEKIDVTFSEGYPHPLQRRRRPTTAASGIATAPSTEPTTAQFLASSPEMIERAVRAARQVDVAIVIAGTNHSFGFDTEGADRKNLKLPYNQDELIQRVVQANPRTIVVLISGGAVEMDPWVNQVPAIVQAWYPGMEGGNAIAAVLFGDINPSGKLPCTFPKKLEDSPAHALHAYPGTDGVEHYEEGLLVGYRWFDTKNIEPLFPFGHGLSYTHFDYSALNIVTPNNASEPPAIITANIANTGARDGSEVVQVYIHPDHPSVPRPDKELKGFQKVFIRAGQQQGISIPLNRNAFSFYDPEKKGWVAEQGDYTILVGSSSRDIRLKSTFKLLQTSFEK